MEKDTFCKDIEACNYDPECLMKYVEEGKVNIEFIRDFMKERTEYYKKDNEAVDELFSNLGLTDLINSTNESLDQLVCLAEKAQVHNVCIPSLGLSYAEQLRKQNSYMLKIKTLVTYYMKLNKKITHEIEILNSELEKGRDVVKQLAGDEGKTIEELKCKIKNCEKEISRYENKYEWLSDDNLNLISIRNEIDTLEKLRFEKIKLLEDMEKYHGLEPDIIKATKQLSAAKKEYDYVTNVLK